MAKSKGRCERIERGKKRKLAEADNLKMLMRFPPPLRQFSSERCPLKCTAFAVIAQRNNVRRDVVSVRNRREGVDPSTTLTDQTVRERERRWGTGGEAAAAHIGASRSDRVADAVVQPSRNL